MNYAEEAIGIAAPRGAGMPVAISFTVETDGRLPTGQTLGRRSRWSTGDRRLRRPIS